MAGVIDMADTLGQLTGARGRLGPGGHRFDDGWPYIRGAAVTVAAIAVAMIGYMLLTPVSYVSRWTLILPGASSNVSLSLESIGQASSTPNQPFNSASLSPKVVYKEIAESDPVRASAALASGLSFDRFGKPRIKLIDETALMVFEIQADEPELARRKANALITAFNSQLDQLRSDELDKRSQAVKVNLATYQDQVRGARERIAEVQMASGLLTTNQFNETLTTLTNLKRRVAEIGADLEKLDREQAILAGRLAIDPRNAGVALKFAADPALVKVIADFSESNAQYLAESQRLGPAHPALINIERRRNAVMTEISDLAARAGIASAAEIQKLLLFSNGSHQAELFQALLRNEAVIGGRRSEFAAMTAERDRVETEVAKLSGAVAQLEQLKKDLLVAEAVFSSAMARLDTSKSDIYGSYPIVQVLTVPNLPEARAAPRPFFAALGGGLGSLLALIAWSLAWLQHVHTSKRRKSA